MMRRLLAWGIVLILAAGMVPTQAAPVAECRLTHQVMAVAAMSARPSCCAPETSRLSETISGPGCCRLLTGTPPGQTPPAVIALGDALAPPAQTLLPTHEWGEMPPHLLAWTCLLNRILARGQPPPRAPPPFS